MGECSTGAKKMANFKKNEEGTKKPQLSFGGCGYFVILQRQVG